MTIQTPVVLTVFNRPDTTRRVLEAIRRAQPTQLFVIADAPRAERPGEAEKCAAAMQLLEQVDWQCHVQINRSEINLGPQKRIASGLDWVFEQVPEAIILEHDCLPHPTFFQFCEELLEHYRYNDRVFTITGQNVQFSRKRGNYSYYFSHFFLCWGWATWRRAWKHYDSDLKQLPEVLSSGQLQDILLSDRAAQYWSGLFRAVAQGEINTWDYQIIFAAWLNGALHVSPNINLISNIGFGAEAANTTANPGDSLYAEAPTEAMPFPLRHPPVLIPNRQADNFTQATLFDPTWLMRARSKINRTLGKKYV